MSASAVAAATATSNAAEQRATTTIGEAADKTSSDASAQPSPIDEGHRVYVGNLSNETTEDELRSTFSKAGDVVSLSMPKRRAFRGRTNMQAIAFVGYAGEADAAKAVEQLNGTQLGGQTIEVAKAKPTTERKPREPRTPKQPSTVHEASTKGDSTDVAADVNQPGQVDGIEGKKPRAKRTKSKTARAAGGEKSTSADEAATEDVAKTNGSAQKRAPRVKAPLSEGRPSENTLFVAGLTFDATDDQLKELFSEFNPTSAHVALRPIPVAMIKRLAARGEKRKGRGFGFVSFADVATQQKALEAMNGKTVDGRELAVKVAIDSAKHLEKTDSAGPKIEGVSA